MSRFDGETDQKQEALIERLYEIISLLRQGTWTEAKEDQVVDQLESIITDAYGEGYQNGVLDEKAEEMNKREYLKEARDDR